MKILFIRMLVLASMLCGMSASAILIDFEDYIVGLDVVGQPSSGTKWSGSWKCFFVTNAVGGDGGKCIQFQPTAGQYNTTSFTPAAADWGGVFDTNKVYEYSYDMQLPYAADSSGFLTVWLGRNGGSYCVSRFGVAGNGNYGSFSGVLSDGQWHTISGEFQYSTHKYSLYIDGNMEYEDHNFYNVAAPSFGDFGLNTTTTAASNYVFRVDNVYLEVKPQTQGTILIIK
ncbi:MAG: hypothetical protein PF692_12425 [Kiritimatiellae bacterium]|jgi:hypothetical protein|nr:hypothetical protein [Kiritimatiellia bacterium]